MFTFIHSIRHYILACEIILRTLIALVSNVQLIKDLLEFGGLVYVLSIFAECTNIQSNEQNKGWNNYFRQFN